MISSQFSLLIKLLIERQQLNISTPDCLEPLTSSQLGLYPIGKGGQSRQPSNSALLELSGFEKQVSVSWLKTIAKVKDELKNSDNRRTAWCVVCIFPRLLLRFKMTTDQQICGLQKATGGLDLPNSCWSSSGKNLSNQLWGKIPPLRLKICPEDYEVNSESATI